MVAIFMVLVVMVLVRLVFPLLGWSRGFYLTEYRIVYRTRVPYDYTRLSLGLYLISFKCLFQNENNVVLNENSVEGKLCINR